MKEDESEPVRVILTTAAPREAEGIARHLVERRLAACVNLAPVTSYYRWKGEFCCDQEVLLVVKTTLSRVPRVLEEIRAVHPYELPEMLVLPVEGGYPPYLAWVREETTP